MKITQRLVERLKAPAKGNVIVYDGEIPGFGVRKTAAGVVAFVLDYRFGARKRRLTIGRAPDESADSARVKALDYRKIIREGTDPLEESREKLEKLKTEPTVADLAERYTREHMLEHNGHGHQRNVQSMLNNLILPRLGRRRLSSIYLSDIVALHNWVASGRHDGKKRTLTRANRVHSLVRSMFSKAINWGMYEGRNPARQAKRDGTDGVKRFREEERQGWQTELSDEQFAALDRAITYYNGRDIGRPIIDCERDSGEAIRLLILNGSRMMQIVAARWDEFDLKRGLWFRPSRRNKSKKPERMVLSDATLIVLRRMKERAMGPYLFPGRFGDAPRTTIRRPWVQICRTAGLAEEYTVPGKRGKPLKRYRPLVHIHDLRHSYASWLVNHGTPLEQVGKLLGQADPKTTRRYAHLADATLRNATNAFGAASLKWVQ
jgi:integrase